MILDTTDIMIILRPPRYQSPKSKWLQSDQLLGHPAVATDQAIRAGTKLVAGSPTVMHLRTKFWPSNLAYPYVRPGHGTCVWPHSDCGSISKTPQTATEGPQASACEIWLADTEGLWSANKPGSSCSVCKEHINMYIYPPVKDYR